jgi:hypothetical protein
MKLLCPKTFKQVATKERSIQELLAKDYLPPYKEPIVFNIDPHYEVQRQQYEDQLNKVYGTIRPVYKFTNYQSIILHHCSDCGQDFYAKPLWRINLTNVTLAVLMR